MGETYKNIDCRCTKTVIHTLHVTLHRKEYHALLRSKYPGLQKQNNNNTKHTHTHTHTNKKKTNRTKQKQTNKPKKKPKKKNEQKQTNKTEASSLHRPAETKFIKVLVLQHL